MPKMTENGTTTLKPELGQEQYEYFEGGTKLRPKRMFHYDYRHTDGNLFSIIKPTLGQCRKHRDHWLKSKKISEKSKSN